MTQHILHEIGSEMKRNPPKILARTRRKKGAKAAEQQRRAIMLSKMDKMMNGKMEMMGS